MQIFRDNDAGKGAVFEGRRRESHDGFLSGSGWSRVLFSKGCDARVLGFLQLLPDFPEPVEPLVLGPEVSPALSPSLVIGLEARGTIGLATIPFAGLALGAKVVVGRT